MVVMEIPTKYGLSYRWAYESFLFAWKPGGAREPAGPRRSQEAYFWLSCVFSLGLRWHDGAGFVQSNKLAGFIIFWDFGRVRQEITLGKALIIWLFLFCFRTRVSTKMGPHQAFFDEWSLEGFSWLFLPPPGSPWRDPSRAIPQKKETII